MSSTAGLIFGLASLVTSLVLGPGSARAQEGAAIPIGEAELFPSVRIDYLSDDNVRLVDEDEARESGSQVVLSPTAELVARRRLLDIRVRYDGRYSNGAEDPQDFDDHSLGLNVQARIDRRRLLVFDAVYRLGHQPFGFGLTEGRTDLVDEPAEYGEYVVGGRFRYGVPDARGNLEAGLRFFGRRYTNLEQFSDGRDYQRIVPYGLFSYRLSGDTRALLELRYATHSEESGLNDRDSVSLFGGLAFAATGRLRGEFRVGATSTDYQDENRDDLTIAAAEAGLRYAIREYVTLGLDAERSLDDTGTRRDDGTAVRQTIADTLTLSWDQEWSSRISHDAYVRRIARDRECPSASSSSLSAGLEVDYAVRRWLTFGASIGAETRDADVCEGAEEERSDLEFDRRLIGAHVRVSL